MKRGKRTERMLQKKLAEGMPYNRLAKRMPYKKLAKKALALLLAAVTAVAGMGTSIGMMSPVKVQAAAADDKVDIRLMDDAVLAVGYSSWDGCPTEVTDFGNYKISQGEPSGDSCKVTISGTANYVTGFDGFNKSVAAEQEGYYVPICFLVKAVDVNETTEGDETTSTRPDELAVKIVDGRGHGATPFGADTLDFISYQSGDSSGFVSGWYFSMIIHIKPGTTDTAKMFAISVDRDDKVVKNETTKEKEVISEGNNAAVTYEFDYSGLKYSVDTFAKDNNPSKSFEADDSLETAWGNGKTLDDANKKESGSVDNALTAAVKENVYLETEYDNIGVDGDKKIHADSVTWYEGDQTGDSITEEQLSAKEAVSNFNKSGVYTYVAGFSKDSKYTVTKPVRGKVTLEKNTASITCTLGKENITKKCGDETFSLSKECGLETNSDKPLVYTVKTGDEIETGVVTVDESGNVTINKGGTAAITVSTEESDKYTAATKDINITVEKLAASAETTINKSYKQGVGASNETIDISKYMPSDIKNVQYTLADNSATYIESESVDESTGVLTYTVGTSGSADESTELTVTASSDNYENITVKVKITLTDKTVIVLKEGNVSCGNTDITYGTTLGAISLDQNTAKFVESGTETEVEGTVDWTDKTATPDADVKTAEWTFTPSGENWSDTYVVCTGYVNINVRKATPKVEAPTVGDAEVTYNPAKKLSDSEFNLTGQNGTWTVGDTANQTVAGNWAWKDGTIVPTVDKETYTAVFTPTDTKNYNTVEKEVTITVNKATPHIAAAPTVRQITYGQKVGDAALTGGTAQYSASVATSVPGNFAWDTTDAAKGPSVTDSGSTEYTVIFTPTDSINYATASEKLTITVNKASSAPNKPTTSISASNSCKTVSDVTLPKGWTWQEADKTKELTVGTAVNATAVYSGTDADCYEDAAKTATVSITRQAASSSSDSGSGSGNTGTSSGSSSSSSSGSSGSGSGSSSGSTGSSSSTPATTTNPDGSTTTIKTETKPDGTKVTTETTTAADGSKTETVTEIKKDGTTTETTTETKTDGTKTESVVETSTDGSKTETTTETKADGSKTESVTEKAADGSVIKSTETVTASDGSATKTETENTQNTKGNDVEVTTTTKTDAAGTVTSITEKTEIPESSSTTSTTVTVKKDGTGEVISAEAEVENTISSGSKATISAAVVSQITEAAGTDSVAITMTVKDQNGTTKYEVKVDSKDMESGNKLYIYKLDTKTGKHVMVNAKTYTVSDSGSVSLSMKKDAAYELVDAKEAAKINKEIKASIAPKKASQDLKPGKKTSFKLSSKANKESIKSITYLTSNKGVAAVSKNGKITAKKSGTATVKAKVTLLNGSTKTIKMKVKVKK